MNVADEIALAWYRYCFLRVRGGGAGSRINDAGCAVRQVRNRSVPARLSDYVPARCGEWHSGIVEHVWLFSVGS